MSFLIPHSETEFQAKLFQVLTEICVSSSLAVLPCSLIVGNMLLHVPLDICIFFVLTLKANSLLKLVHAAFLLMSSLGLPRWGK